jgi:hypothetical protein
MDYGRLTGNDSIDGRIHELLGRLDPDDVPRFVRKFRSDPDDQCFHTYRELILGSHLRARGWNLRYEQTLRGKTPDWVLIDDDGQAAEFLDVVTLHQRRAVDSAIAKAVSSHRPWAGWVSTPPDRLHAKLREKAEAYASLAEQLQLPYLVAVFGEFTAPIEPIRRLQALERAHQQLREEHDLLKKLIRFTSARNRTSSPSSTGTGRRLR